jgi:hypothetical protein
VTLRGRGSGPGGSGDPLHVHISARSPAELAEARNLAQVGGRAAAGGGVHGSGGLRQPQLPAAPLVLESSSSGRCSGRTRPGLERTLRCCRRRAALSRPPARACPCPCAPAGPDQHPQRGRAEVADSLPGGAPARKRVRHGAPDRAAAGVRRRASSRAALPARPSPCSRCVRPPTSRWAALPRLPPARWAQLLTSSSAHCASFSAGHEVPQWPAGVGALTCILCWVGAAGGYQRPPAYGGYQQPPYYPPSGAAAAAPPPPAGSYPYYPPPGAGGAAGPPPAMPYQHQQHQQHQQPYHHPHQQHQQPYHQQHQQPYGAYPYQQQPPPPAAAAPPPPGSHPHHPPQAASPAAPAPPAAHAPTQTAAAPAAAPAAAAAAAEGRASSPPPAKRVFREFREASDVAPPVVRRPPPPPASHPPWPASCFLRARMRGVGSPDSLQLTQRARPGRAFLAGARGGPSARQPLRPVPVRTRRQHGAARRPGSAPAPLALARPAAAGIHGPAAAQAPGNAGWGPAMGQQLWWRIVMRRAPQIAPTRRWLRPPLTLSQAEQDGCIQQLPCPAASGTPAPAAG